MNKTLHHRQFNSNFTQQKHRPANDYEKKAWAVLGKVQVQIYFENKVRLAVGLRGFHQYNYVTLSRVPEIVHDYFLQYPL